MHLSPHGSMSSGRAYKALGVLLALHTGASGTVGLEGWRLRLDEPDLQWDQRGPLPGLEPGHAHPPQGVMSSTAVMRLLWHS